MLFRSTEKSGDVFAPLSEAMLTLHRQLKSAFDPHGILNRGRMLEAF
jgi:glycolate oxidase FAD binding subunit